jgi:pimeloyl-ACP methyl ester carboxylesterase
MAAMPAPRVPISRRWRRRRIVYPALYIAFLLMTFAGCADRLILYPSTGARRFNGIERRDLALSSGARIEIWTARTPAAQGVEPEAYLLTFIGNADRAESAAYVWAQELGTERSAEVWAVNYPGFGGSTGPARLKSIAPAALAAYDELLTRAHGKPIFVAGQSLGTTAALHVGANRPVAGCILWSPPPLQNMILSHHGWWNLWLLACPIALSIPSELDSLRYAPKVTAPAVFLETGNDSVVPVKYQRKVSAAYAGEKQIVRLPKSEHNAVLEGEAVRQYDEALDRLWQRGGLQSR